MKTLSSHKSNKRFNNKNMFLKDDVKGTCIIEYFLTTGRIQGVFTKWPAQSPDMNPIEHLWAIVKEAIAKKPPKNLNDLKARISEEWSQIPPDLCQKLSLSFKKKALSVYRAKEDTQSIK